LTAAARDILQQLADLGAKADRQGDKLILRAGTTPVPKAILATIRERKTEVLQALSEDGARDEFAERAALTEAGAKVPVAWLEGFARLDPGLSPADVPPRRWEQFVDDARRFLDGGFAEKAAALCWGPLDLFGCNRDRPFARIDQAGLCWLIGGNRLVDLAESAAIIETWTGARQTYRRKRGEPGRALAWDLAP